MERSLPLASDLRAPARRVRPALAAKGFRPFFLLAALFALAIVPLWLAMLVGALPLGTYLDPPSWHAHEMIFGFAVAVIAGFLLTAVGNWTRRETLIGAPLLGLASVWLLGRVAMSAAARLPYGLAALIDLAFLPLLAVALARSLFAARDRRNYSMLGVLAGLFICNALVHAQALGLLPLGVARRACLAAVDVVLMVILIILGRVLPMFTRNATGATDIRSLPALDRACVGAMLGLTVLDGLAPGSMLAAAAAEITATLAVLRALHWGARHSWRQPLLWILHAGYAWLVVGLVLRGIAALGFFPSSLATHVLTVGTIGGLTLGMMARVALGHTGRLLEPPRVMTVAFIAIQVATAARVVVPWLWPATYLTALWIAGAAWMLAFGLYAVSYAHVLVGPRVDGKPG
jgi:uncharacterized protein involved in response to NO